MTSANSMHEAGHPELVLWMGCCGPLMDQNLVVWSQREGSKREKEARISWVTQRTNKALGQGLYYSRRHRVSSRRGL